MHHFIGSAAGTVWEYLNGNGPVSYNMLARKTGMKQMELNRAIGWLARENKIRIEMDGRRELLSLVGEHPK